MAKNKREDHARLCLAEVAKKLRDPNYALPISEELLKKVKQALAKMITAK